MKGYIVLGTLILGSLLSYGQKSNPGKYMRDLQLYGQEPVQFVRETFNQHDLLVFDDALHSAFEPFVFYNQLINEPTLQGKIQFIFLEAINTTAQPLIDSFLRSSSKDTSTLIREFQDDYAGTGWRYQTYLDLFTTVWEYNHRVPEIQRIQVIGVNPPIYWEAIHSAKDYEIFQNTLASRDYAMYLEILRNMEDFKKGIKGLFLCNTRHAYTNIKDSTHQPYLNTTTFFSYRNPGKVFSIRIHNVTLSIEAAKKSETGRKSTDGLNQKVYKWIRMDNGAWDAAFAINGNKPVAIPFRNTSFGKTAYVGNHMLNVAKGTTMADAYDALIFLAPLNELHFSAQFNYIYTASFKPELERRLKLMNGNEFDSFLKNNHAASFDEYYQNEFKYIPMRPNKLIKE
jgi:hypothetical protein